MPTPIAHSIAAVAIGMLTRRSRIATTPLLLGLIFLANAPDLDFIPGYMIGSPGAYHWGPSHSIAATIIAGMVGGLALGYVTKTYGLSILLATAAYGSHVLMDLMIGGQSRTPVGLQLLWPFSTLPYRLEWAIFRMAPVTISTAGPVAAMFSQAILPILWRELTVMVPILGSAWFFRRYRPLQSKEDTGPGRSEAAANLGDVE